MTPAGPPRTIRGVVFSEHGEPARDIVVSLTAGPVPLQDIAALTGPRGEFTLTAPVAGTYVVTVSYPTGRQESRTVELSGDATEVTIEVRPTP